MKAKPLAIAIIAVLAATAATRIQAADAAPAAAPQQQPAAANPAPPQQQAPPAAAPAPVPPATAATIPAAPAAPAIPAAPAPDGPGSEIGKMMAEAEQEKARAAMLKERLERMKLENEIKFGASFMPPPSTAGLPPALPLPPPPSREGGEPKAKEGGPEKKEKEEAKAGGRPAVLGVFGDPKDLSVRLSAEGEQRTCKAQERNCRVGNWRLVSLYGGVAKLTDGKATVAVDY